MGFSTVPESSNDPEMLQLPRNIYQVRVLAGYTKPELAEAAGISLSGLVAAEDGAVPLLESEWQAVLDVCGKRAFDADEA